MLHIQIDAHSGVPVYRQIMDQVRYYAAGGQIRPGDRLPSIRELAKYLHINPTTIVKAYSELAHGGEIEMIQGKGAFLTEGAKLRSKERVEEELRKLVRPLAAAAVQLGVSFDRIAELLRREMAELPGGRRPGSN
jgi:GntR family transcriptional regulator